MAQLTVNPTARNENGQPSTSRIVLGSPVDLSPFDLIQRVIPTGLKITPEALEAARTKLNAQYVEPTTTALASRATDPGDGCPQCGGAGMLLANPKARPGDTGFGKSTACPHPCHSDDRLRQLALLSNLDERELSITLDDLEERHDILDFVELDYIKDKEGQSIKMRRSNRDMLKMARQIIDDPYTFGIVYILGPNGNGKTTAGQAICNGINKAGKGPAMYINLIELIAFIRASYDPANGGPTTDQRYKMISETPCLIVDEFDFSDGKNADTQHTLSLVQRWLNDRYRLAKIHRGLTVLIGNEPVQELGLNAINSRIGEGWFTRITNTAPDERPEATE